MPVITVSPAQSPRHFEDIRTLVREFVAWGLATFHPEGSASPKVLAHVEQELADLPGKYAAPEGGLFVADLGDEPAGCIAGFRSVQGDFEVSRLWVRSGCRGLGAGDALVGALLQGAEAVGYSRAVLRSRVEMTSAHGIYRRAGFAAFDGGAYFANFEASEIAMQRPLG